MAEISVDSPAVRTDWSGESQRKQRARRYAAERRLRYVGIGAITIALSLLGILIISLSTVATIQERDIKFSIINERSYYLVRRLFCKIVQELL